MEDSYVITGPLNVQSTKVNEDSDRLLTPESLSDVSSNDGELSLDRKTKSYEEAKFNRGHG